MQRSIGIKWGKLRVGVLILFAIVVLVWASLTGGGPSIFDPKGSFVCYFRNVNGLIKGSPVWMSGLEIGHVSSLELALADPDHTVRIVCKVKKSVWLFLTQDASVQLGTIGFLGDKYIEIIPGVHGGKPIEEMDVIETKDVGSAPAMFKAGQDTFETAGSVVRGFDSLLIRMNRGEGTLGRLATDEELYTQLTGLVTSLTRLSADLQENQARLISSIEKMSNSVADLSGHVNENTGTIGKLMNDPALYDNLSTSSAHLDTILTRIEQSSGTAGLLVNDTALYVELTNLLARANNLITDIEKNPRRYFKFSVF